MASILVQLAGTNGSGKSTPMRMLYNTSQDIEHILGEKDRIVASWLKDHNCVVVGHYENHNGGCDGVSSGGLAYVNSVIADILADERFTNVPVYFEGLLMASMVNMRRIHAIVEPYDIPYILIHCDPPLEICLTRIYSRNGDKPINEFSVQGRHASQRRYMPGFGEEGLVQLIRWCTEDYDIDEMLPTFMSILDDVYSGTAKSEYAREFTVTVMPSRNGNSVSAPWDINPELFAAYWYYAYERLMIFYRRLQKLPEPWTEDKILQHYKFTNTFRVCDRVSQYLLRNVMYAHDQAPEEVIFRTLLFKLFNRIETWEELTEAIGIPTLEGFSVKRYGELLNTFDKLFSNAYMITGHKIYGYNRKHWNYLQVLQEILIGSDGVTRIPAMSSLREVYEFLLSHKGIKEFLAYQYAIDLNYSQVIDFDENDFTVPGTGARRGIKRCFNISDSEVTEHGESIIMWMVENQERMFAKYGYDWPGLFGRPLHAIDAQNVFCETDKYARAAFPEHSSFGRTRIKQNYSPSKLGNIELMFPPNWGLTETIGEYDAT